MKTSAYTKPFPLRNAVVAMALASALWILPWAMWSSNTRPRPMRSIKSALRVQYLRNARGLDGTAWSPVLIPLSPKWGFSMKADRQGGIQNTAAALRPPVAETALMQTPPERAVPGMLPDVNPRESVFKLEPVEHPAYAGAVFLRGGEWLVESMDGLANRKFRAPALREINAPEGAGGWLSASAYLELGAEGRVEHVFLERSAGFTNVDQAVIRALRAGYADPGVRAVGGRVRVTQRVEED